MTQDALRMALEALENHTAIKHPQQIHYRDKAITAIKEALAQTQEPVAWMCSAFDGEPGELTRIPCELPPAPIPLYTCPPQRKPLTDEMVVAAARVLNERQADDWGVDRDEQWVIYSDEFKDYARAMLAIAYGIKE